MYVCRSDVGVGVSVHATPVGLQQKPAEMSLPATESLLIVHHLHPRDSLLEFWWEREV